MFNLSQQSLHIIESLPEFFPLILAKIWEHILGHNFLISLDRTPYPYRYPLKVLVATEALRDTLQSVVSFERCPLLQLNLAKFCLKTVMQHDEVLVWDLVLAEAKFYLSTAYVH